MELIQKASSVAMIAFVLSSMVAMGLGLTVSQIIAPPVLAGRAIVSGEFCFDAGCRSGPCRPARPMNHSE